MEHADGSGNAQVEEFMQVDDIKMRPAHYTAKYHSSALGNGRERRRGKKKSYEGKL